MLDKAKFTSNLKYANRVERTVEGFSAEIKRLTGMYETLREISCTAVPDLPNEYLEKMAAWAEPKIAQLDKERTMVREYAWAIRSYTYANSEDASDREVVDWVYCPRPLEEFDKAEMDKLLEKGQVLLETNGLEAPLLTAWP